MDSKKAVIVVLVLIAAAFIFLTAWGSAVSEKPKRGGKTEAAEFFKKKENRAFVDFTGAVKNVLGGLGGKMTLPCAEPFKDQSGLACSNLSLNQEIKIPPEKDVSFRTVTFVLVKGRARIEYEDRTGKAGRFDLDEQDFELPNPETEDPKTGSIVALEDGGVLTVSCIGTAPCEVGQE